MKKKGVVKDESMKGLFYIVKGHYKKVLPTVVIRGETKHIGGYDPYSDNTQEWYRVLDCVTYHCIYSGASLDRALETIKNTVKHFKNSRRKYFKMVCDVTSEDYYETHYLGRPSLTEQQRRKKAEGRCPRVSPVMKEFEEKIRVEYSEFFSRQVEDVEEEALEELRNDTPLKRSQKRFRKIGKGTPVNTPQETPATPEKSSGEGGMKLKRRKALINKCGK